MKSNKNYTLATLMAENRKIYQVPDDRLYTADDLIYHHQKFIFRLRQESKKTADISQLNVATAWFLALVNRFHIDLEKAAYKRYPYKCPFCLDIPCTCRQTSAAQKTGRPVSRRPQTVSDWQAMIGKIYQDDEYPQILDKFFESFNQLNFIFRLFLRKKKKSQFVQLERSCVDHFMIILRIYNTLEADLTKHFQAMFNRGCYVCHRTPCVCNYFE